MWGSIAPLIQRLDDTTSDLDAIEKAFGPVAFVHLRRDNVLEQAVSWSRAEQTGYWQDGDSTSGRHHLDLDRLNGIRKMLGERSGSESASLQPDGSPALALSSGLTIDALNAAWQSWFRSQGREPIVLTYEEVVGDPRAAVTAIARHVSVELPTAWDPQSRHRKQADETNGAQVAALRQALDAERA